MKGPTFKDYIDAREGSRKETNYVLHYNLFSSLEKSLSYNAKCIEFVTFNLKDDVSFSDFYEEWTTGLGPVESSPGCCPIILGQQIEDPTGVVQIQPWMTLEDHIEKFKKRKDLVDIVKPLGQAVQKYVKGGWGGMKTYHLALTPPGEAL